MDTFLTQLANTIEQAWTWLRQASPWLQGLFGGAGVTLLWEGLLKPRRERLSLAHVLAEEVGFNLQLLAGQLAMFEHNPSAIPGDFRLLTKVYEAVTPRLGELDTPLVGEVVLLYGAIEGLNSRPATWVVTLDQYHVLQREEHEGSGAIAAAQQQANIKKDLDIQLAVFKSGVVSTLDRANKLLPRLRRAAVPAWRLDYLVRPKKRLELADVRSDVASHARRIGY